MICYMTKTIYIYIFLQVTPWCIKKTQNFVVFSDIVTIFPIYDLEFWTIRCFDDRPSCT